MECSAKQLQGKPKDRVLYTCLIPPKQMSFWNKIILVDDKK